MKTRIIAAIALSIALLTGSTQAQYTDNFQTNTISGVASNWAGDYYVGQFYDDDILLIQSGGALSNGFGYVGWQSGTGGNTVLVTDPGSVWSNANDLSVGYLGVGNSLTVTNGGAVYDDSGYIGDQQFADDNSVLVTGSGSVWSNRNGLYVGELGSENSLIIASGGTVYGFFGVIGGDGGGNNNAVLVTGGGSVFHTVSGMSIGPGGSGNSLTITNGGKVVGYDDFIGGGGNNNAVLVTGSDSVWSNDFGLFVGFNSSGNSLTIADGGVVVTALNDGGPIGYTPGANNNTVLVTGSGSVWTKSGNLYVGFEGSGNSLTIAANGSAVVAGGAYIGNAYTNGGNGITVSSGGSFVSSAVLDVRNGALTLNSGSATANQLVLTNDANSVIAFNGGLLTSSGTSVTNSQLFVVGDGTDAATFHLSGGVHSFADNLEISSNAVLTGCGTIEGNVTVDPGGTVLADCGGMLTFTGIVTNNGTMQAVNGTVLQVDGQVVNNGVINAIDGSTQFLGGLVNNGCVLTETNVQISSITRSATNITVQIPSATCGSYQLQVTPSLKPPTWTNLGASLGGTGGVLTFTDTNGATNRPSRFYRIDVTLP